jgi:hypothetical protein
VARFKAAYEGILMPIKGRSQWPKVNPGFDMIPPKLKRSAGRPRTRRIKVTARVELVGNINVNDVDN